MNIVKEEAVKAKPKKQYVPRIVVCPDYKSLDYIKSEFISLLGARSLGLCLVTLKEAIEAELPLRKAQQDFSNKIANDIYITTNTDELIPSDYLDSKKTFVIDKTISAFAKMERKQERNKACLCESGKKYKHCCI